MPINVSLELRNIAPYTVDTFNEMVQRMQEEEDEIKPVPTDQDDSDGEVPLLHPTQPANQSTADLDSSDLNISNCFTVSSQ